MMLFGKIDQKIGLGRLLSEGLHEDIGGLSYDVYAKFFDAMAIRQGFRVERLPDSLKLYERPGGRPITFITSGQHGDERAGPIALLEMLRDEEFPVEFDIRICPIVNPAAWDLGTRESSGLNSNRVWTARQAPAGIMSLMLSVESRLPDLFLDLHETDQKKPKSGKMFELRHTGGGWGRAMMRSLGSSVADVGIRTHIHGSAEKYAHELGVVGTAAVESNIQLPLSVRVEFHKQVIRTALGI